MSLSSRTRKEKLIPELLAPAGSPEAFRAAVAAGADALYLSGKRFGARKSAPNFTDAELKEAVRYAHSRDIGIYVTINTLIYDRELSDVAEYLIWLYSIGVDAVLVQDIGVVTLARDIVPLLPLHASTQMTIHSAEGVRWAADQGFSRVVLARELTLDDIKRIAQETGKFGIGLEVFAHGALCYCYSGQCLLSSVIGGRSGNRGMCAQPCRKPYTLVTGVTDEYGRPKGLHELPAQERFLLSPKDLCIYENLPEIVRSPVVSLKIEGRMKSAEYVSVVVSTYRRALDAIAAGKAYETSDALQDLCLSFNRGFTPGYLFGKHHAAIMGRDASDNRGMYIGNVSRYDKKSKTITIRLNGSCIPGPGDGLVFTHPQNTSYKYGFSLNTVPVQKKGEITIKVPHAVEPGMMVYITSSTDLVMRARQITAHPQAELRHPVPLNLDVRIDTGGNLVLEGLVHTARGKAIPLVYCSDCHLVPARSNALTREQIEQQLKKTGGTPFLIRNFTLTYSGELFTPLAGLNRVRREFLKQAEEMMVAHAVPPEEYVKQAWQRWNVLKPDITIRQLITRDTIPSSSLILGVCTDSLLSMKHAVDAGCDVMYFEPVFITEKCPCRNHTEFPSYESQIITASGICRDAGIRFVLKFPRITDNSFLDVVFPVISQLSGREVTGVMVENCGTSHFLTQIRPAPALYGSTGLNIFNHVSVRHLSSLYSMVTLSPELSRNEIRMLIHAARRQKCPPSFALIVQGNSEVMVSEDCIFQPLFRCKGKEDDADHTAFYGIMDATGHTFPVRIDGECRSHIYNSAELCLIDHIPSLMQIGINEVIIDARGRTGTYTGDIISLYRKAIHLAKNGVRTEQRHVEKLKGAVKHRAIGGITTGHFIRGLKES